jgi:hypothetical protein
LASNKKGRQNIAPRLGEQRIENYSLKFSNKYTNFFKGLA